MRYISSKIKSTSPALRYAFLWIGSIAFSLVLFSFIWFLPELFVEFIPELDVFEDVTEDKQERIEKIDSNREYLLGILQSFAGLTFIATVVIAWRNYKLTEDKNVTERLSKAGEMLADEDKLDVRLVGIYLLDRLIKDSKEDSLAIIKILITFVKRKSEGSDKSDFKEELSPDIQSALTVIGISLHKIKNEEVIDLGGSNFPKARLQNTNFSNSDFNYVNLREAKLQNANFSDSDLRYVNFQVANLESTTFEDSDLSHSTFEKAILINTSFSKSNLSYANFQRATLQNINLEQSILFKSDFSDAIVLDISDFDKSLICQTTLPKSLSVDPNRDCEIVIPYLYGLTFEEYKKSSFVDALEKIRIAQEESRQGSLWISENIYFLSETATESLFETGIRDALVFRENKKDDFRGKKLNSTELKRRFANDLVSYLTWIAKHMLTGLIPKGLDDVKVFLDFENKAYIKAFDIMKVELIDPKVSGLSVDAANMTASYINRFIIDQALGEKGEEN
ncbi:MAG: pentapeptide repeat-containing protein [Cyanobacteria bacterium P01_G01_bin.54]